MKSVAWVLRLALKAGIFFTLFAFALNNQGDVTVHFFFGRQWTAPMVLVVLGAFTLGLLVGVLGMVPRWWRQRRLAAAAKRHLAPPSAAAGATSADENLPPPVPVMPPHGL